MLHTKEYLNHISIAYDSRMELETHLQIAARLNYLEDSSLQSLLVRTAEINQMLK
jgi:four helix bundle protein